MVLTEVLVREVGGSMAPLWKNFLEPSASNSHRALLYVVDVSAPEKIGSSTIHLVEILFQCQLLGALPVMVVFTKTDLELARPLHEVQVRTKSSLKNKRYVHIIKLEFSYRLMEQKAF